VATQDLKGKLTAILSAYGEGDSRLMGKDEESTVPTITVSDFLKAHAIDIGMGFIALSRHRYSFSDAF
jgi:hypothetical protein